MCWSACAPTAPALSLHALSANRLSFFQEFHGLSEAPSGITASDTGRRVESPWF